MIRCLKVRIRIVVEPDEDRFYAHCPELKGIHVEGNTQEEALKNARDAAMAYIDSLLHHNDPLPLCAEEMSISDALSHIFASLMPKRKTISKIEELEFLVAA